MGAGLVLSIMNQVHASLVEYHVPAPVAAQLFTQIYHYINAVLFNCIHHMCTLDMKVVWPVQAC